MGEGETDFRGAQGNFSGQQKCTKSYRGGGHTEGAFLSRLPEEVSFHTWDLCPNTPDWNGWFFGFVATIVIVSDPSMADRLPLDLLASPTW